MRVYISVELPGEVKKAINELISKLKRDGEEVKWIETQNLHITLKFLGWVEENKVEDLTGLVTKTVSGTGSFIASFQGIGTFPEGKNPRVVWAGTAEGGDRLCDLAKVLEETLSKAGYRSEERGFAPHITIGRVKAKKGVDRIKEKIDEIKDSKFGEAIVDRIFVMKSTLTPKGPIYEKLKEVKI